MLQFTGLKEDKNEIASKSSGKSFTLIFKDDDLTDQACSLLETCLRSYIPYKGIEMKADVVTGKNGNYIKLVVIYPKSVFEVSNQEIEDDLESHKKDFENYYQKVVGRIK